MITPSSLATRFSLVARGKDAPIQKFSSTFPFDRTQASLLESTYRHDANAELTTATLSDSEFVTQFVFINDQGRVGVFTCPKLFQDPVSRDLSFIGSYSDDLGDAFPMAVHVEHFKSRFTTLIPKDLVERFALSTLEQVPDNIPPPPVPTQDGDHGDPALAQDEDATEPPSMERLQFGDTSIEARHPRIAALPSFFPMPKGKRIPCDLDLTVDEIPTDLDYIPFTMWLAGCKYLLAQNEGISVTKGGPLFSLTELDTDGPLFDAGGIIDRPQLGVPAMLQPGLPAFVIVTTAIKAYSERCWMELGSASLTESEILRQEAKVSEVPAPSSRLETNITELAASFRMVANAERKTAAEKENDELAKDVLNRFCVSFGRVVLVPHGEDPVFRPATPTVALTTLLKKSNAATAQRLCKESLRMAIRTAAASSDRWDDRVDYSEVVANSAFVQAIQQFSVFTDSVNANHAGINTQLSLWNFLIPETAASSYESLLSENNNLLTREVLSDTKTKTTPGEQKTSTLYTKGKLSSIADVLSAICNFRVFWKVYIENFDDSTMWQSLQPFLLALRHPDGKEWSNLSSGLLQVPFNLLVSLQTVVGSCFALGTIPEYVLAVKNDTTLSNQVVRSVDSISRRLLQEVEQAITLMRPDDQLFAKVPAAMVSQGRLFSKLPADPASCPAGRVCPAPATPDPTNKRSARSDSTKRDDKRARNGPNPDIERKKQAGMLVYSGDKLPPVCTVFITKEGSTTGERVCMFFCTKGYACTRKACKRPHIPSLSQFPTDAKRTEFCEFVKGEATLSFVEGKGPSAYVPALTPKAADLAPHRDCLSLAPIIPQEATYTTPLCISSTAPTYFGDATTTHCSIEEVSPDDELFMYPKSSVVTYAFKKDGTAAPVPTLNMSYTKREREHFVNKELSPRVAALLDQSFGKENLCQSFTSEACLRHCLLPVWKSGFLHGDDATWRSISELGGDFQTFGDLLLDLGDVDFNSIRGFQPNWQDQTELNDEFIQKVSAALLHFDGDVAALVRWVGGPHVGAHRDVTSILANLQGKVEPGVLAELERIFTQGIPRRCVAQSTERNFQANLQYGNHKTMDEEPTKTYKALVKDVKRGFALVFDQRLIPFLLNCHLTAQGLIDLMKLYKQPRNIFDSSFRVFSWCMAINDWTSKLTEPEIHCCAAAVPFMIWIWNLRISYPWLEIFLADNDVAGAFRWMKYHPNLCAMHTSVQCDHGVINTGGTFGDNTTPSNWDVIALSRIQASQWRWEHDPHVSSQAREYLSLPQLAPPPPRDVVATFVQADADSLNPGVLRPDGSRLPPPYDHHVDDCLYADVAEHMVRTVDSSVMGLYDVLGKPCPEALNVLSGDKLDNTYSHIRKGVGCSFNSRRLTVGMLDYKKEQLLEQLDLWIALEFYTLLGAASMQGTLQDHTKFCPWVRPWFFALQNLMRVTFTKLYHVAKRRYPTKERSAHYKKELPQNLWKRIDGLVSKDQATFLWNMNVRMNATDDSRRTLLRIRDYLRETDYPWETPIGLIIPRIPHSVSWGDASKFGAGGYCPILRFWFDTIWSERVVHAVRNLKPADPGYVHINSLEFIAIILQLAAVITRLRQLEIYSSDALDYFPNGIPNCYAHLSWTDNTTAKSWTNKVTTKSQNGQRLLTLWSELLLSRPVALNVKHIAAISEASYHADLGLFPPESRIFTAPLLAAVHGAQGGPPKSPKDLGTIRSHRIHYLMFASRMKWDDDLLLEKEYQGDVRRRGVLQLSMYALHLAAGNTLFCRRIQANTIEKYVKDAASFLARAGRMYDYRKTNATDTAVDPILKAVYKELHRYDTVPNRREPFTPLMLVDCQTQARKCTDSTCLTAALGDWFAVGLNAGLRRGEWAQADTSCPSTPDPNMLEETKAFILVDIRAETNAFGRLTGHTVVSVALERIRKMWVRFRTQKNGQNGEERMFTRNPKKDATGCFVAAMYRIIQRFVTLCGPLDLVTPLSVYRGTDGDVRLIRAFDIEQHMRAAASRVYKLHPKRDKTALQRWSSHSLRVGACVLLHAMRFTATQIKWLLRWLSDTFMMYLRNVALLSDEHHQALDEAAGMPHFF